MILPPTTREIIDKTLPGRKEIDALAAIGFAAVDRVNGFTISTNASHADVDSLIRKYLPVAFSFLDKHPQHRNRGYQPGVDLPRMKYLPPYLLCQKAARSVSIVPQRAYPVGHDIQTYAKSLNRGPATENVLMLGTLPSSVTRQPLTI
jgi:hypothetical protein